MQSSQIAVYSKIPLAPFQPVLEALSSLYAIRFEERAEGQFQGCSGLLLIGVSEADATRLAAAKIPAMAFVAREPLPLPVPGEPLSFGKSERIVPGFRGRVVPDSSVTHARPLGLEQGDDILVSKGADALWIHRPAAGSLTLCAVDLPTLGQKEFAYEYLQRGNFMALLPIIHFLRSLTPWKWPALRACFMFDDPNLHWKTYGYVRYAELADHAEMHNYHASFATVPFDGWYVHPHTADLFRAKSKRLSLLIHGNNHTYAELAQFYPNGQRQIMMAQALRRVAAMEKRTGVEIARVMAAPHGGCSVEMAKALLEVGFEAASISRWSLMHHNPGNVWDSTVGFKIAEFLSGEFPIIPRFKLAKEREVDIYLNALLEKPLIMVGHHDDLREGLKVLEFFAEKINSTGSVSWVNMTQMARSNFCTCRVEDTLFVQMHSRRITLEPPASITRISVQRAWSPSDHQEILEVESSSGLSRLERYAGEPIPVPAGRLEVNSRFAGSLNPDAFPSPPPALWATARRGFCEVRDRIKPLIRSRKL